MLERQLPVGIRRDAALARLDSMKITHTGLDSTGSVVRVLVHNTSSSVIAKGSLQVMLSFANDSKLLRREFKEMLVAP